jgi:nucleoside-diphosphate-sugar epimerase
MLADALLLQVAMIGALVLRFLLVVWQNRAGQVELSEVVQLYVQFYLIGVIPVTAICLGMSLANGLYTRGRYYQTRYKGWLILQSVTVAILGFGFIVYFLDGAFWFNRTALVLTWVFGVGLLWGARVWNGLWQEATVHEPEVALRGVDRERSVLVVGGAGYIGSALVPQLLEAGYRTRVLDIMMFGPGPLESVAGHPKLEIIQGDFRHINHVVRAIQDMDAVVHLGAIVGDPACRLDENLTIDVNLSATRMLAELAKAHQVKRFVFASTCSVYGACQEVLDERSETRPVGIYGHTKLASERVLRELSDSHFAPTILRFATIYGLSGRTRFDLVVNLLTAKAKIDGEITVFDGNQWRPFVHVQDAARSIVSVLQAPSKVVSGEIFNVGSTEQNYTIEQIGELVHQQVISAELKINPQQSDPRDYRVDFTKIQTVLDFQPRWTVEQGIQQVLEAIASGRIRDYRDPMFSNEKFLSQEGTVHLERDRWAREMIETLAAQ